jgi:multidrug resistance efflux pump
MTAVQTLVAQRDDLIAKAEAKENAALDAALDGDRAYERAANLSVEAFNMREEVKRYNVAIGALGGEPKPAPVKTTVRKAVAKVKAAPAKAKKATAKA